MYKLTPWLISCDSEVKLEAPPDESEVGVEAVECFIVPPFWSVSSSSAAFSL